jgi:hypothetical protein
MWSEFSDTSSTAMRETFRRPTILRFNSDTFMDELLSLMEYHPERLIEWQAQPETWREPMTTPKTLAKLTVATPLSQFRKTQTRQLKSLSTGSLASSVDSGNSVEQVSDKPLKLYQPAHQRFYLVTASLVCRRMGLPDRLVDLAKQQKVEFVVRRLLPKKPEVTATPEVCNVDKCDEYAFIASESGNRWQKVQQGGMTSDKALLDEEERLPMFNVGYEEKEDKKRRMLAGFIPVGKREAYINAIPSEGDGSRAGDTLTDNSAILSTEKRDAITHLFQLQVAGPWKSVISQALNEGNSSDDWFANPPALVDDFSGSPAPDPSADNLRIAREKIQTTSWYILVDFVQFLEDYLPNVHSYIKNSAAPQGISQAELDLYEALVEITLDRSQYTDVYIDESYHSDPDLLGSLLSALKYIIDNPGIETELDLLDYPYDRLLENTQAKYSWPDFLFPLADPVHDGPISNLDITDPSDSEPDISHDQIDALTQLVSIAIPGDTTRVAPDVTPIQLSKSDRSDGWFVIRCVFESPNCGPFQLPIMSESTVPFKMASFFDPDAPGRPIIIPMPLDISPAGLRKFNKNASFMISDMLCGKIKEMRKTTLGDLVLSVLPWPFHKDLPASDTGPCTKGGAGFGMFCSLSIPIVTLCAMILLIIMVTLFDIFFRWLPLLFMCIPVPRLGGKKDA